MTADVKIETTVFAPSGYSFVARKLLLGMNELGLDIHLVDNHVDKMRLNLPEKEAEIFTSMMKNTSTLQVPLLRYGTPVIWNTPPDHTRNLIKFVWENDRLPPLWRELISVYDEYVTVNKFVKNMIKDSIGNVPKPIHIVNHGVDTKTFYPDEPMIKKDDQNRFVFLSLGQWIMRKGFHELLKSYLSEFTGDDKVNLIIKTYGKDNTFATMVNIQNSVKRLSYDMGLKNPPHILVIGQMFNEEGLRKLYNSADCFILPSKGESWCLPYMQSMACFPYNTLVDIPSGIEDVHVRHYDGKMIRIETESSILECTPEHPIFTVNGWKMAKDILIGDELYELYEMDKRRIGSFERKLGDPYSLSNFKDVKETFRSFNKNESKRNEIKENKNWKNEDDEYKHSRGDDFISGWVYRRRWNNNISTSSKGSSRREIDRHFNSSNTHMQQVYRNTQLVETEFSRKLLGYKKETTKIGILYNNFARNENITFARKIAPLSYLEEETMWNIDFVYKQTNKKTRNIYEQIHKRRLESLHRDEKIKSKSKILSKSIYNFSGKVYNIATSSGIYFANGILVHNCGIPCIAQEYGGHLTYMNKKNSFLVKPETMEISNGAGWYAPTNALKWAVPSIDNLRKTMRYAYEHPSECSRLGTQARKDVKRFTWKRSAKKLYEVLVGGDI